ncbi:MAG: SemiSWEET family transporter, partial [Actinomycetes bacterium]
MDFRTIFSLWCISLSFTFTIPQAYRVVRRNTVEGISVPSQLQNVSGSILWVIYGIASSTHLVVLANLMTICGFGTVVFMQVRLKAVSALRALGVEVFVILAALVALAISRNLLGAIAVVVGATGIVPQVFRAAKTSHLVGISVVTFIMVATMSTSWGIYGLLIDDVYVALPNVVIVP